MVANGGGGDKLRKRSSRKGDRRDSDSADTTNSNSSSSSNNTTKQQKKIRNMDLVVEESESPLLSLSALFSAEGIRPPTDEHVTPKVEVQPATDKSRVIHVTRHSILSSESSSNSYRGFMNLGILLLVLSQTRLVIMNIQKYGLLLKFNFTVDDPYRWPSVLLFLSFSVFIAITFLLEKYAAVKKKANETFLAIAHTLNITALLVWTIGVILAVNPAPVPSVINLLFMSILFMKLISYAVINREVRLEYKQALAKGVAEKKDPSGLVQYPDNVNIKDYVYFLLAPTLVYELNFPRAKRIRWGFVARRTMELIFFTVLNIYLVSQYIVPLVRNAMVPLEANDIVNIGERLLKLVVPHMAMWLLGFYIFFHLYLNIIGELLRFGDRMFYMDWWNATSIDYFWRTWNIPVHRWMLRHVYTPLVSRGYSRNKASFWVFFVSAIFHEFIISVPFRNLKLLAFWGMMAQMPLSFLTRQYTKGKPLGNVIFWLSIMFGHTNCVLIYYRDYRRRAMGEYVSPYPFPF